jgi:hypothetical protein
MLITSITAIILTTISLGFLIYFFLLDPRFSESNLPYFSAAGFYGFFSGVSWLVARGYYLDSKKEIKSNTNSS